MSDIKIVHKVYVGIGSNIEPIAHIKKCIKSFKENLVKSNYLFLGGFVAVSLTGDFIQNHSISVLFFLIFFQLVFERTHE